MEAGGGPFFERLGPEEKGGRGIRIVDFRVGAEDGRQSFADIFPLDGIDDFIESVLDGLIPVGAADGGPLLESGAELTGDEPGDGPLGKEEEFEGALGIRRIPAHGQDQGKDLEKRAVVGGFARSGGGKAESPEGFIQDDAR